MKRVNGGYAFNAAMTESDIGIKEEFKVVSSDTTIRVDAIFGIDLKLRPVKPAIFRQGEFMLLQDAAKLEGVSKEDMFESFMRSNKSAYSILASTFLFCRFIGKYNTVKDCWEDETRISLYTPKAIGKNQTSDFIICAEVSNRPGVDTVVVSEDITNHVRESLYSYLPECIADRGLFLGTRAGIY